jgi:hypothetical protein
MPRLLSPFGANLAEIVPLKLRTLPIIKQFYWQDIEIEEIHNRADQLAKDLDWYNENNAN